MEYIRAVTSNWSISKTSAEVATKNNARIPVPVCDEVVDDLQNELKTDLEFVDGKMKDIEKQMRETENGTRLKLDSISPNINNLSTLTESIKEFNNSMFGIKKNVEECDRQLQISLDKVHRFLSRRKTARIAGASAAGGGTILGVGACGIGTIICPFLFPVVASVAAGIGMTAVASGAAVAVLNRNNEEEKCLRAFETTIECLQEKLNGWISILKEDISAFQSKNIPVADW